MDQTRRDFLKTAIAASVASGIGISVPASVRAEAEDWRKEENWKWDKSVCRFCGVGCGIMVASAGGKLVSVKGDPESPVNRGLNCIKGYFNATIMYGEDRLTKPLLRMKDGKYDKHGKFAAVSWDQAFDVMEAKFKEYYGQHGPSSVAIFGSGQYTIDEGYAAAKFMKAGVRSNNIDPNARHCMASAVAGFIQTFGIDEPSGCYDDIEFTDAVVSWGANMAECHPILWSRVTDRKLAHKPMKIVNLSTFSNRSSDLADLEIIFEPQTDLAILNYIARSMIEKGAVDQGFVDKFCVFAAGPTDIGYGLPGDHPREQGQTMRDKAGAHWAISFEEFKKQLEPYTLEYVSGLSGVPKEKLVELAEIYADRKRKVVSFWTMGFNQHTRGTWVNEQIYMVHLLGGKISTPGSSPFSLTGQPSACGTAREVGVFAHRLPSDMVVANKDAQPEGGHARREDGARPAERAGEVLLGDGHEPLPGLRQCQRVDPGRPREGQLHRGFGLLSHRLGQGGGPGAARRHDLREVGRLRQRRAPHPALATAGSAAGGRQGRPLAASGVLQALPAEGGLEAAGAPGPRGRGLPGGCVARRAHRRQGDGLRPRADALRGALRHEGDAEDRLARPHRGRTPQRHRRGPRLLRAEGALAGVPAVRARQWP
jgi:anaerobic selenocysteine-containing dehydrogenase